MRLFNIFTESKDHDANTNEPSSQAHSMKHGRGKRKRECKDCDNRNREDSPLSIKNIINKLEKEQNPKRNVGTAGTYQVKVPNLEQPIHA